MSLKKKIVLSFLLSAFIIALLSAFLYLNFVEIKKETVFLELADTIRSRSLQLRRHEKNFLLYVSDQQAEIRAIQETLDDLAKIVAGIPADRSTPAVKLRGLLAAVNYLQELLGLHGNRRFIAVLLELQARIAVLRKSGESILEATEAIDKEARASNDPSPFQAPPS